MKKNWILYGILFLAAVLRLWRLDSYPALNADEAAIGYNAYSLIETGTDEHGRPWPVHFQSFNDYKPGLYFYLVLPFVKLLGLNEWAVRLPGAILGVSTVLILYLLVKELFPKLEFQISNRQNRLAGRFKIADVSAFFLAISPWHIHFSRGGWEVNVATFLVTLGMLLFLKALKKPSLWAFAFSILSFTLSLYAYHSSRILVPLLGLGIVIFYRRYLIKNIKYVLGSSIFGLFLLLPLFYDILSGDVFSRAAGVGLFADRGPISRINEQRGEHTANSQLTAKFVHNKPINYGLVFLENWAAHYHGEFLFLNGDIIQRNKVPETGQMFLFDILFLAVGFFAISKMWNKEWKLVLYWLAVAPVAAALTFQSPHALRAQNMVVPLTIIASLGAYKTFRLLVFKKQIYLILPIVILMIWQFARYQHMYWVHMAKDLPYSSQYGVKELVKYLESDTSNKEVIVSTKYDQPYILFLFYLKFPPAKFIENHILTSRDEFGFSTVPEFDRFKFTQMNYEWIKKDYPGTLIVGAPDEIPSANNIVKKIYGSNGYEYFFIVAN